MRTRNSEQEDYILRMIQEIGRAIARLRAMLCGSTSAGSEIRAEVSTCSEQLLGADAGILRQLDALSAARLIGNSSSVELWAQLLELEAESWARDGDTDRAAAVAARAAALRAAAVPSVGADE